MKKAIIAGLAALVLSIGCGAPKSEVTQHTVPVREYTVKSGDRMADLAQEEYQGSDSFYDAHGGGVSPFDFVMDGGSQGYERVQYHFDMGDIVEQLNPGKDFGQGYGSIRAGETIMIPDLNNDGKIGGDISPHTGDLKFTAAHQDGKLISKDASYQR